jgi:hypothetical protein
MSLLLVNMIPKSLSGETGRDSECNVAVDPADPQHIAASAFTLDPMNSGNAPIFISVDGGNTWNLNVVLPGGNKTGDTTLRFGGTSGVLYAGILRTDNSHLNILRTANFTLPGLMAVLVDRAGDDQPWVEARTVPTGLGSSVDRVFIGNNDLSVFSTTGKTATIDESQDAATAAPPAGFGPVRVETRTTTGATSGQDGPSIRPAIHADGTVYGAYFGWRSNAGATITSDVVVVRDGNWGSGANPYQALIDPADSEPGLRVVKAVSIPALSTLLGTQRIGSQIAIAVDPRQSSVVYPTWADGTSAADYTIHLRRSTDSGSSWSTTDLRAVVQGTNPAVAVNSRGAVGFLYQKLVSTAAGNRWETHLEVSGDGLFNSPSDVLLANVPDANGSYTGINPIGDYASLLAVGSKFYGAFSANNTPDLANFPNGVIYQRNADFTAHQLTDLANSPVAASIDPFFLRFAVDELQVVGLSEDGGMWHTIRHADGTWVPAFGDVKAQEANNPGRFTAVGCAEVEESDS